MRKVMLWSTLTVAAILAAIAALYWSYWSMYARFQPRVIVQGDEQIEAMLEGAGWVSDGHGGAPVYLVGWRDCASCSDYQTTEFPRLRAGGVEPRVILFARPDQDGLPRSTAHERATVAELWSTRDFTLLQRWTATPSRNWTAAGVPPADGSTSRTEAVETGRVFHDRLVEALRASGIREISYPLVIWRDREGVLKACACSDPRAWAFIRDDVGAAEEAAPQPPAEPSEPAVPVQTEPERGIQISPLPYPEVDDRPRPPAPMRPAAPVREDVAPRPRPRTEPARPPSRPSRPETRPEARPSGPQRPATTPRPPSNPQPVPREEEDDTLFF